MTVQAGESQAAPAATQAPLVDADALANSIVNAVARINQNQAPAEQAAARQRASNLEDTYQELLKSGNVDKDVMPIMKQLVEAAQSDLSEKQKLEFMATAQDQQTRAIHNELGRMVERFAQSSANPELIRELKSSIVSKTIAKYNNNPSLVNQYQRTGDVDWNEMEKTVVEQITKWGGAKTNEKQAGGPAMKNDAPSGIDANTARELDADSLNEKQREIFNSQTYFGTKNMGLTREKAEERALKHINAAEQRMKSAKR